MIEHSDLVTLVAHELVGLVLANQTSAATAATLDQHLRPAGFPTSPTLPPSADAAVA
jgi:hypothetical protein